MLNQSVLKNLYVTLTANIPFSLVESQSTTLKERFESVGYRVMNLLQVCLGAALRQTTAGIPGKGIMGLRPMGGPLSYKQLTLVRFRQLRFAGRHVIFGNIAQLVAASAC